MQIASQSIEKATISRIYGRGRGCVFTPNEFLDLGSRSAIDLAMHRLTVAGTIRRIARGLYYFPESHADSTHRNRSTSSRIEQAAG